MIIISLLHATFESEVPLRNFIESWKARTVSLARIEYILCYSRSDEFSATYITRERTYFEEQTKIFGSFIIKETPASDSVTAVQNWNEAANLSQGQIQFVISDDVLPEYGWDQFLETLITKKEVEEELVWKIQDKKCLQLDDGGLLLRHPIVTKTFIEKYGGVFDSRFLGRGADDYLTYRSVKNRELKEIKCFRLHHSYGKIIDDEGILQCGCESTSKSQILEVSVSQKAIATTKHGSKAILRELTSLYFGIWGALICNQKRYRKTFKKDNNGIVILKSPFFILIQRIIMFFENRI